MGGGLKKAQEVRKGCLQVSVEGRRQHFKGTGGAVADEGRVVDELQFREHLGRERATFEQGVITSSLPTIEVKRAELEKGVGVLNASLLAGFVQSTGEARRQIKGGGLKVNDKSVADERRLLTLSDLTEEGVIKLSLGKKRHVLIRPV